MYLFTKYLALKLERRTYGRLRGEHVYVGDNDVDEPVSKIGAT